MRELMNARAAYCERPPQTDNSIQIQQAPSSRAMPSAADVVSILRKRIVWVPGINKTGGADGQKSFHFIHRLGNYVVWCAAVKLGLQLNKSLVRAFEPMGQYSGNVKHRRRIL